MEGRTVNVGAWAPGETPFVKTSDLIRLFMEWNRTFPVMIFDCCYMGGLLSLLECSHITRWVCADPGYTGWDGITSTRSFWNRKKGDPIGIGEWLQEVTTEHLLSFSSKDDYLCYFAFDLSVLALLWHDISRLPSDRIMRWGWNSRYSLPDDEVTYDMYSVLMDPETEKTESVMRLIAYLREMMRYSPYSNSRDPMGAISRIRRSV